MVSIDISSLLIVTTPDFGNTSHRSLSVNDTLPVYGAPTSPPMPSDPSDFGDVIANRSQYQALHTSPSHSNSL